VPPGTASGLIPEVVVRRLLAIIICSFVVWGGAACGQDDGGTVKEEGSLGASSGSGSSSGDASASAPADASGSEVACVPVGDPSEADSTVEVSLDEWSIDAPERIDAGTVALATTNDGEEPHELVVVRADSLADLPRDGDGEIDETAIGDRRARRWRRRERLRRRIEALHAPEVGTGSSPAPPSRSRCRAATRTANASCTRAAPPRSAG
jgi:hypothetical protein